MAFIVVPSTKHLQTCADLEGYDIYIYNTLFYTTFTQFMPIFAKLDVIAYVTVTFLRHLRYMRIWTFFIMYAIRGGLLNNQTRCSVSGDDIGLCRSIDTVVLRGCSIAYFATYPSRKWTLSKRTFFSWRPLYLFTENLSSPIASNM